MRICGLQSSIFEKKPGFWPSVRSRIILLISSLQQNDRHISVAIACLAKICFREPQSMLNSQVPK
ncbi:hypothetical protein [Microcoleus sp. PH2017_02_FOX_O_A]|uniref:hypothetical protein n=1 Tax=Microcoleus sp. PH2017_02_FOX_O_A TaxID=2798813 RepID=UPI001D7A1526|nr:hypothetical protein [Microcoleus sp. PH2017_02_FOX_O_A]MCC3414606.1 hypothetical protein [Microcoleus sp. PH2017_02_FOX_O_A]